MSNLTTSSNRTPDVTTSVYNSTNSTNGTDAGAPFTRDEDFAKFEILTLALILYMALFGNGVVICVLKCRRMKLSRMQIFIIHLCITDIGVGLFQVIPQLIEDITFTFHGNDFLCKLVKYMQIVTMYASSYVLVMTALDRYMSICHPLTSQTWTHRRVHVMVLVAWTLSALFAIPQLIIFSYKERVPGRGQYDCLDNFDVNALWKLKAYITWIFVSVYVIPLVILTVVYVNICYVVWINVNSKENSTKSNRSDCRKFGKKDNSVTQNGRSSSKLLRNPRAHSKRLSKSKIKTIKLTLTVVICFLVCWFPFFFVQMWSAYDMTAPYLTSHVVAIVMLLSSLNSCTNPWIYLAFSGRVCGTRARRQQTVTLTSTMNTNLETDMRMRTFNRGSHSPKDTVPRLSKESACEKYIKVSTEDTDIRPCVH